MDPLVRYYFHQAGRVRGDNGIGPIYGNPNFLERGHGFGSFLGGLWRSIVGPLLLQDAKPVSTKKLVTGRNILSYMARNTDPNAKIRKIMSRNMAESEHMVINKWLVRGANVRGEHPLRDERPRNNLREVKQRRRIQKYTSPNRLHSRSHNVCGNLLS
jgi:hypothetical protein